MVLQSFMRETISWPDVVTSYGPVITMSLPGKQV